MLTIRIQEKIHSILTKMDKHKTQNIPGEGVAHQMQWLDKAVRISASNTGI